MVQSKRQRKKRQVAELEADLDDALAFPNLEGASVALKSHLNTVDTENCDPDQQLDDLARATVGSIDVLLAAHVEQGADISRFFGAVCPVHMNNWECLDQEAVS